MLSLTRQSRWQKMKNQRNQSGLRGVYEIKDGRKKKWRAEVQRFGKKVFNAKFYTAREAGIARDKFLRENYPKCAIYTFDDIV